MKSKILLLLLFATACIFILLSCEKETTEILTTEEKIFTRTFDLVDSSEMNEVTLIFKSTSKSALDQLEPEQFKLTAINSKHKGKENSLLDTIGENLIQNHIENLVPENVIAFEVQKKKVAPENISLAIEFKSLDNDKDYTASRSCGIEFWYTASWARRVQINNLSTNPLSVSFYHHGGYKNNICPRVWPTGCVDQHVLTKKLYKDGKWYYFNCDQQVAARVFPSCGYYQFKWYLWEQCNP